MRSCFPRLFADFEAGEEGFLGDVDLADALHALFAFFLFVEEFLFAGDVASVALGDDVFADGADGFAGYDFGSDGYPASVSAGVRVTKPLACAACVRRLS